MLVRGFAPIVGNDAQVVILGTLPGGESLTLGQYYANSRNAFWYIVQQLFGVTGSYDERERGLVKNRIAVWDVLEQAERRGSTDGKIVRGTEVPNDFAKFFRDYPSVKTVFFNGSAARRFFRGLVIPRLELKAGTLRLHLLPSTSPANTHATKEAKLKSWCALQPAPENGSDPEGTT